MTVNAWPLLNAQELADKVHADPGDLVLDDGTRIVARHWGHGWYDATVLPASGLGWSTGLDFTTKDKAIKIALRQYLRLPPIDDQPWWRRLLRRIGTP